MNKDRKKRDAVVILLLAETAASLLIAWRQGLAAGNTVSFNARCLSDGCFIAGFIVSGIGVLTWIASTGFFDMMSYGLRYGIKVLIGIFFAHRKPQNSNFYEYKMAKEQKREEPVYFILICGLIFIGMSLIFLKIYYM